MKKTSSTKADLLAIALGLLLPLWFAISAARNSQNSDSLTATTVASILTRDDDRFEEIYAQRKEQGQIGDGVNTVTCFDSNCQRVDPATHDCRADVFVCIQKESLKRCRIDGILVYDAAACQARYEEQKARIDAWRNSDKALRCFAEDCSLATEQTGCDPQHQKRCMNLSLGRPVDGLNSNQIAQMEKELTSLFLARRKERARTQLQAAVSQLTSLKQMTQSPELTEVISATLVWTQKQGQSIDGVTSGDELAVIRSELQRRLKNIQSTRTTIQSEGRLSFVRRIESVSYKMISAMEILNRERLVDYSEYQNTQRVVEQVDELVSLCKRGTEPACSRLSQVVDDLETLNESIRSGVERANDAIRGEIDAL